MSEMTGDLKYILYTEELIQETVSKLAERINAEYKGKEPLFVGILKGSFVFMADLIRKIDLKCSVDFMVVSSYGSGRSSTGAVKINKDLSEDIEGRDVILVEDILDSGLTLSYLIKYLQVRKPASIRICTLLDKPARRTTEIVADYTGIICPDEFIVGYGLDYAEKYRNLPYIGVLKPEAYA
jgi:hypoxanthine phosphoribosyltransferase